MLKHFASAPLSRRMPAHFLRGEACDCRRDLCLQFLKMGAHRITYLFLTLG